jgi:cell division protein FtsL
MNYNEKDNNILHLVIPLLAAILIAFLIVGYSMHQNQQKIQHTNQVMQQEIRNYYDEVYEEIGLDEADEHDHEKLIIRVERCEKALFGRKK